MRMQVVIICLALLLHGIKKDFAAVQSNAKPSTTPNVCGCHCHYFMNVIKREGACYEFVW